MSSASARAGSPVPALHLYVGGVIALGASAILVSIAQLPATPFPREWALFAVLGVLAGSYAVRVPGVAASISVSDTFFLASAMLFGPAPSMLAIAVDSAITSWRRKYNRAKLLFNACGPALALYVAAHLFFAISGTPPLARESAPISSLIVPLAGMTAAWFILNSGLTAIAVALDSGVPVLVVWKRFALLSVNYAAAASASFCVVIVLRYADLTAAAAVLPLVFIFHLTIRSWLGRLNDAQQHVEKVDRLYLSTVETLATAIEAKDGVTHDHIRRVQIYAVGLARALGVRDESTIKAIEAAALLHDTGKLAVPEHILNKPGKLTHGEFEQMKRHVDVGAEILSAIDFPYPVVPIVRCHHENWDGSGYPNGVKGTDIPIGARILSVVDCYDALTSDRPYRRALSHDAAVAVLLERRGTMYDPLVIDTFIRIIPGIAQQDADAPHSDALAQISRSAAPTVQPAGRRAEAVASAAPAPGAATDRSDVAALAGLARIVTPESPFDDVLSLAASHVRHALGRGTCALYLSEAEMLIAARAVGPLADVVGGLSIPLGGRLTGWVAAHRRTIVNSDAQLDLSDVLSPDADALVSLSTPLLDGDALVGVLSIYSPAAEPFGEEQRRAAEAMAPHLARMFTVARRDGPASVARRGADAGRELRVVSSRRG